MKRFFRRNNAKKGFTLVELIVVIAIVAILTAVSIAGYYGFMAYANQSAAEQEAKQFKDSVVGQFSLNYYGKTSQNAGIYGTVNKNGLRLSKSSGDNPSDYATSILAEAFTYSENPSIFNSEAVFDFSQTSLLNFDGSETDGIRPSLLSPKMLKVEEDYFITEVTYQSKNTYKSTVKFTDLEGQEVAPSKPIDMSKTPSGLSNVQGFKESYAANELVDFSNVKATVEFTDGTSAIVGAESLEITETTGSSGLHHRGVSGNRTFTISYRHGQDAEPVVAPTYSVPKTELISESSITEIKLPKNVQQFKRTLEISPDSPAGFKKDKSEDAGYFFVGKQNPLKFEIDVICIDNRGHVARIDPKTMTISYKLDETVLSNTSDCLDLTAVAEGHHVLTVTSGTRSVSLNIKVIDAWNVYTAQDLKKFDNTRPNCYDYTTGTNRHTTDKGTGIFEANPQLITLTTPYIKMNGTNNGVVATGDNDATSEVRGIVLQNSIKIKPSLFDRHIYTKTGKIVRDNGLLEGNNTTHLFKRHLNVGEQFYFEGNYFTVDASSMPYQDLVGTENGFWPELFAFAHDYENDVHGIEDIHGNSSWYGAHVERMNVIGNGGKVDNLAAAGSLIIFNNKNAKTCEFNFVNITKGNYGLNTYHNCYEMIVNGCKISNCFTTTVADDGCGHRTLMARTIATKGIWVDNSIETSAKITFDPRATGVSNELDLPKRIATTDAHAGLRIYNSVLRDAGGPAVVLEAIGNKALHEQDASTEYSESWDSMPTVDIDDKTQIVSYITGTEPFFVVQHLSDRVEMVSDLDGALAGLTSNKYTLVKERFFNCMISLTPQGRDLWKQATDKGSFTGDLEVYKATGLYPENMEVNIGGRRYIDFNEFMLVSQSKMVGDFEPFCNAGALLSLTSDGRTLSQNTEIMLDMHTENPNPYFLSKDVTARISERAMEIDEAIATAEITSNLLLPGSQYLGIELPMMGLVMGLFNK